MRIVFIGASEVTQLTAETLAADGHDVIIVEKDKEIIDSLAETLDCSFLHGDGSEPSILEELNPKKTDILFCLSSSDQDNIIASLVGKSLGFKRVVTSIVNQSYLSICMELGLEDTIVPAQTISGYLADMTKGQENLKLSTITRDKARFALLTIQEQRNVEDLNLPDEAKAICYFRDNEIRLNVEGASLQENDEVVVLATVKAYEKVVEQREKEKEAEKDAEAE